MEDISYNFFDEVAELYHRSLTPLPEEYIQLIKTCLRLGEHEKVIDLGCGSGLLTLPLSRFSASVQGLDSSARLLEIARALDIERRVQWIHSPAEEFDFGHDCYRLIISFESFHLFSQPGELIKRCASALKMDGHLCVGWVNYHWELPLRDVIVDVFASNGIPWGEWGYQACSQLTEVVKQTAAALSRVVQETVKVEASSHVRDVASYLACIEKAASLNTEARKRLAQELETEFRIVLSSEWTSGASLYSVAYSKKLGP